jgi:two-component system chemotaxis response regulator CheB
MNLPPHGESSLVPFVCPDCEGPLSVNVGTDGEFLTFRCAIGHRYSLASVVEGKEERVEQVAWTMYRALEELAELFHQILRLDERYAPRDAWDGAAERARSLRRQADRLREIIEANEPVRLAEPTGRER